MSFHALLHETRRCKQQSVILEVDLKRLIINLTWNSYFIVCWPKAQSRIQKVTKVGISALNIMVTYEKYFGSFKGMRHV
jgi:hypothetical protein